MEENKISVQVTNPKSDFVRVGNDTIELGDRTQTTFKTNELSTFATFVNDEDPSGTEFDLFYSEKSVTAFPRKTNRYSMPLARCDLQIHPALKKLIISKDLNMDRGVFENFLRYMGRYGDESVADLFGWVKNFQIKTVTSIQRKKDRDGSFKLFISREKSEKESYAPPETLRFTVPIFKYIDTTVDIEFEFYFDYNNHEDKVTTSFQILNPAVEEIITTEMKCAVEEEIKTLRNKKYWGEIVKIVQDDSWKYKENGIK